VIVPEEIVSLSVASHITHYPILKLPLSSLTDVFLFPTLSLLISFSPHTHYSFRGDLSLNPPYTWNMHDGLI
jgi:hypothetical protein